MAQISDGWTCSLSVDLSDRAKTIDAIDTSYQWGTLRLSACDFYSELPRVQFAR